MADDTKFAQEFQHFLQHSAFTDDLAPEHVMARTDIMVCALTNHLRSKFGTEMELSGPLAAGKVGGGVPHFGGVAPPRMDLLLKYAKDVSH